jgi:hypothetical protein
MVKSKKLRSVMMKSNKQSPSHPVMTNTIKKRCPNNRFNFDVLTQVEDWSYFLTEYPTTYTSEYIELNFRSDKNLMDSGGFSIIAFFIPKNLKLKDVEIVRKQDDQCEYYEYIYNSNNISIFPSYAQTSIDLKVKLPNKYYNGGEGDKQIYVSINKYYSPGYVGSFYIDK